MGWVVWKYGGTSVAAPSTWRALAARLARQPASVRVWVTVSALAGVSDALHAAIDAAVADRPCDAVATLRRRHEELAADAGLALPEPVDALLGQLERLLGGIRLTGEASARLRARVMSFGELAASRLGVALLEAHGVTVRWVDARDVLRAEPLGLTGDPLSAGVAPTHDPDRVAARVEGAQFVLTQGFIAREPGGSTVLLGRGGSDTSASLFGALLGAERVEIWTDVHGMFTADPREIPTARLIRQLGYREAQELAAMGAKVLHPRCLGPLAEARIPLVIRNTRDPDAPATHVGAVREDVPAVTAVVRRDGVTLLTLSTLSMWGTHGFLARAFAPFAELGVSIDLVATSQSAVSVTLDAIPGGPDGAAFHELLRRLGELGEVTLVRPCAVVSIVGRRIRAVLHELGGALAVFRDNDVHLVSESSEDLNLSFVVDEAEGRRLVARLHAALFHPQADDRRLGPSFEQLTAASLPDRAPDEAARWWRGSVAALDAACPEGARYAYHLDTVRERARALRRELPSVGALFYAMKANGHPRVLQAVADEGLGIECVSIAEVQRVRDVLGEQHPVLFTPNFCPVEEYAQALASGAEVTIDGPDVLRQAPDLFRGVELALRVDPGRGDGHHAKVITAGAQTKFGHPIGQVDAALDALAALDVQLIGLHAHIGSGVLDPSAWERVGRALGAVAARVDGLRWLDLGGGLGVVGRPGQRPLDLAAMEVSLRRLRERLPDGLELRLEPGRYLVSEAGVLLARVTQVRRKGTVRFVGLATGMNSLLRPALYGAWHGIHNLSRLDEAPVGYAHVVGPICETGDVLGHDRLLPETLPGDLVLIDNAGAYGLAMASHYNLRAPAEVVFV